MNSFFFSFFFSSKLIVNRILIVSIVDIYLVFFCYDQLTPFKTVKKVSADQYHVTILCAQVYSLSRPHVF